MMNLNALKIDPEFQGKIPPLNFEEEQQLEQNILHEGRLLNPIIIWNGFILDGHTRYRILRKHPFIVYQIQEIELANRYAALSWICQNQLGRRNLDPERKKFLMGKLYESEKLARGGSKERAHDENGRFTSMVQNDQLSVIEIKPYRERQKRTLYPPKESNRDRLCSVIDTILVETPKDYEDFLQKLEQQGYEVKRGKYTSIKGKRQKRFIRFKTLGAGYSEDELKAVIAGEAEHRPRQKQPPKEKPFNLLVDVQAKLAEGKSGGYTRWAKKYNLKEMSKTLIFLQEKKISSIEEMQERVDAATARYHKLGDSIKAAETRMAEIAVLKAHIVNYAKTRPVYDAYRKAGYSKRFLESHRAEITLHKAAKAAFNEADLKKLPKVKELDAEYSKLLTDKKAAYPDYRKAKDAMQELLRAQRNVELFFAEDKNTIEKTQSR